MASYDLEGSVADSIAMDRLPQGTDDYQVSLDRLLDLLRIEDEEERPSSHAFTTASSLMTSARLLLKTGYPRAVLSADGDGGIRIEWVSGEREVRLIIPANEHSKGYIYHQQGENPVVDPTPPTGTTLAKWLQRLVLRPPWSLSVA
ncbi:MAG: hypothetical protein M3Y56_04555 [Armatimonadota bacterium]|nr:hypothetical protein [Armatimonadota bacterium]